MIRIPLVLLTIPGGGTATEIRRLSCLAVYRGLSYQAIDDLKNVLFPDSENGKTGAGDAQHCSGSNKIIRGSPGNLGEHCQGHVKEIVARLQATDRAKGSVPGDAMFGNCLNE
jgi:hypothetical protein